MNLRGQRQRQTRIGSLGGHPADGKSNKGSNKEAGQLDLEGLHPGVEGPKLGRLCHWLMGQCRLESAAWPGKTERAAG